ncbi:hypothetical protein K1719_006800 [Acacia pycnantha]|nr:hypothetical protein K1719_006800 [Acacia pycnantha]
MQEEICNLRQAPPPAMVSSPAPSPSQVVVLPQLSAAQYTRLLSLLELPSPSTPSVNHLSSSLSVPTEGFSLCPHIVYSPIIMQRTKFKSNGDIERNSLVSCNTSSPLGQI